jgi:hypothetical protein
MVHVLQMYTFYCGCWLLLLLPLLPLLLLLLTHIAGTGCAGWRHIHKHNCQACIGGDTVLLAWQGCG